MAGIRAWREHGLLSLARDMGSSGAGPLISFVTMFAAPIVCAKVLDIEQFAFWVILSTITTVSTAIDFGGTALAMARIDLAPRKQVLIRSSLLSVSGSLAVGVIAILAFALVSRAETFRAIPFAEGLFAIALTVLSTCFRGVIAVIAQAVLAERKFTVRTTLLGGQGLLASAVMMALAALTGSAWCLPIAWCVSSVLVLASGLIWMKQNRFSERGPQSSAPGLSSTAAFASWRSLEAMLSALLLQGDRWVIGALASAEFLATYEISWRFAVLPKFLIQVLVTYLGAEAQRATSVRADSRTIASILSRSRFISLIVAATSSVTCAIAYFGVTAYLELQWIPLFWALILALTLHGLTAPYSVIGIAVDLPKIDLPYLCTAVCGAILAAAVGWLSSNASIYILVNCLALAVSCVWFLLYSPFEISRKVSRGATS